METLCPNKEVCGSCGWSHIPYDKQLQQKLSDINGSFALKELNITCETIVPSPQTSHYRDRMDFVINFQGLVGMRQKGKWWRVIDGHHCFLADERIEKHFDTVRTWVQDSGLSFFDRKSHIGLLRYAVIRSTSLGETMISIVTSAPLGPDEEKEAREQLEQLAVTAQPTTLLWSINSTVSDVSFGDDIRIMSGPGYIEEEVNGTHYRITPNAFFQTNLYGAPVLQQAVLDACGDVSGKTVLDLYCGSGFFANALAAHAQKTIGVELVPEAIRDAKVNAALNGLTLGEQIDFFDAKTEDFNWKELDADIVIVDPPRSGMHDKALADIIQAAPEHLVYVSCNYKHFAREMVQLQNVYDIEHMIAIDMFPHTPHVELVTSLKKKK